VHADELMNNFNVGLMPEVRRGTMSEDEARTEYMMRLEGAVGVEEVSEDISFEQFLDYYTWLSCSIIDDGTFVQAVETAWRVEEVSGDDMKYHACVQLLRTNCEKMVKGTVDKQKCERVMRLSLRQYDLENKKSLTIEQFCKGVHLLSCSMDEAVAVLFFDRWGGVGGLDYEKMSHDLFV